MVFPWGLGQTEDVDLRCDLNKCCLLATKSFVHSYSDI